jgi:hypothetical protein
VKNSGRDSLGLFFIVCDPDDRHPVVSTAAI